MEKVSKSSILTICRIATCIMVAMCFITACESNTVYYRYERASLDGWEKNDTIVFDIPPVKDAGTYKATVGIRVGSTYPFEQFCLVVENVVLPDNTHTMDTLRCRIQSGDGKRFGDGVGLRYHGMECHSLIDLHEGDSLHIAVRHNMKRHIVPGISDVGIRLERQ